MFACRFCDQGPPPPPSNYGGGGGGGRVRIGSMWCVCVCSHYCCPAYVSPHSPPPPFLSPCFIRALPLRLVVVAASLEVVAVDGYAVLPYSVFCLFALANHLLFLTSPTHSRCRVPRHPRLAAADSLEAATADRHRLEQAAAVVAAPAARKPRVDGPSPPTFHRCRPFPALARCTRADGKRGRGPFFFAVDLYCRLLIA